VNDWLALQADLQWRDIDMQRVGEMWPELMNLPPNLAIAGVVDGSLKAGPAGHTRSPEPLALDIALRPRHASLGGLELSDMSLTGHVGRTRIMIEAPNVQIASGAASMWGMLSWAHRETAVQMQANFREVNLDRVVRAFDPEAQPVPGLVSGSAVGGGLLTTPHRAYGQADMTLMQSDLANLPMISVLYNALNLQVGKPEPAGEGRLLARLDGDALEITRLTYFNRGSDVIARVRIDNVWAGPASPIRGFAVGAMRPLKKVDLPFIQDVDEAMEALQAGAASVRISGTVGKHEIKPVPFADIAAGLGSAFSGAW
jgi:hypothetical protein